MNDKEKMTKEQIENWRKVLCLRFGAYALIMPENEIEKHRNALQNHLNGEIKNGK